MVWPNVDKDVLIQGLIRPIALRTAARFRTSAADCEIRQPELPIFVAARLYPNHTVADAAVQQPSSVICRSVGRLLIPVSDGRRPDPATRSEPPKRAALLLTGAFYRGSGGPIIARRKPADATAGADDHVAGHRRTGHPAGLGAHYRAYVN